MKSGYIPDHDLVVARTVNVIWISGSEDVVRDVATHAIDIVFPLDGCGHALDVADELTLCEDLACVDVAFDIVLTTLPGPCGAPLDARAGSAVKVRALRTRGGSVLAPEVVKNFVAVLCVICVLAAETDLCLHCADIANGGCSSFLDRDGYDGQIFGRTFTSS